MEKHFLIFTYLGGSVNHQQKMLNYKKSKKHGLCLDKQSRKKLHKAHGSHMKERGQAKSRCQAKILLDRFSYNLLLKKKTESQKFRLTASTFS